MTSILCRGVVGARFLRGLSPNRIPRRNHTISLQALLKPRSSSSVISTQFLRVSTMSNSGDDSHRVVQFALSPSSALKIQKGDITQWFVDGSSDAIVSAANEKMLGGGGGADGAIHRVAGPELREACYNVQEVRPGVRCPTGEARITPGFKLPASHVIHTVGPIYDVDSNPEASLKSAYRNSVRVAKENNIQYIAFPAISCGVYRYPLDEAATVAISSVKEFTNDFKELQNPSSLYLPQKKMQKVANTNQYCVPQSLAGISSVHFVLFTDEMYNVWCNKANELLQN